MRRGAWQHPGEGLDPLMSLPGGFPLEWWSAAWCRAFPQPVLLFRTHCCHVPTGPSPVRSGGPTGRAVVARPIRCSPENTENGALRWKFSASPPQAGFGLADLGTFSGLPAGRCATRRGPGPPVAALAGHTQGQGSCRSRASQASNTAMASARSASAPA